MHTESNRRWRVRVEVEFRAGNLTPVFRNVLAALRRFRGRGGIYPSHDSIARRARCSVPTVKRALSHAKRLGLVDWLTRRRPGTRMKTSNRYFLLEPDRPVQAGQGPVWPRRATIDHSDRRFKKESKEAAYKPCYPKSDGEARDNAARQLLALGLSLPAGW